MPKPTKISEEAHKVASDPFRFISEILGIQQITSEQAEIIRSVRDNKNTGVKAAHSVGKTYIEAAILLWFLFSEPNTVVISTAPTGRQVKDLLWKNVNTMYGNAKVILGGKCNTTDLVISPSWYATGISTEPGKEAESAVKLQGYHAPRILGIVDEAFGVHKAIWEALDGILSSDGARILAVGNPSTTNNAFATHLKSGLYNKMSISAFNHPNVINKREVIPGAVSYQWVMEKIEKWCERVDSRIDEYCFKHEGQWYMPNDLFLWKVLGQFPKYAADSLVSPQQVVDAMARKNTAMIERESFMALDVARFGTDYSVFCRNYNGHYTFKPFYHYDTAAITGEAIKLLHEYKPKALAVDCDGLGAGVFDNLVERQRDDGMFRDVQIYEIHSGSKPANLGQTEEFLNLRAQMFWLLREDIEEISIESNEEVLEGLPLIKYFFNSRGKIQIEAKEDYKERVGRSSDYEDALAYCIFMKHYASLQSEEQYMADAKYYQKSAEESFL